MLLGSCGVGGGVAFFGWTLTGWSHGAAAAWILVLYVGALSGVWNGTVSLVHQLFTVFRWAGGGLWGVFVPCAVIAAGVGPVWGWWLVGGGWCCVRTG